MVYSWVFPTTIVAHPTLELSISLTALPGHFLRHCRTRPLHQEICSAFPLLPSATMYWWGRGGMILTVLLLVRRTSFRLALTIACLLVLLAGPSPKVVGV